MQTRGKGNSSGMCVADAKHEPPHHQEGTVNTGCCDKAGFLPLAKLLTSMTTHRCPTGNESNYSFISLTHLLHFAPLPPSTGYCHVQGHPFQKIFLRTGKGHHADSHSTYSHEDGFKLVDSQLEKPKGLMALTLLTHQKLPPLTQCECLLCRFTLS